jgi:hypothetical protein
VAAFDRPAVFGEFHRSAAHESFPERLDVRRIGDGFARFDRVRGRGHHDMTQFFVFFGF